MTTESLLLRATMEAVAFLNTGMAKWRVRDRGGAVGFRDYRV